MLNLLIGPGAIGTSIVRHAELDDLTFTGSTGIGRALAVQAAERGVPFQGELDGKNAAIVLADADLDVATQQVLFGAFRSTGQKCTATSRLIVDEAVADEFLGRLAARLDSWRTGDPLDPEVQMGPLVGANAASSVRSAVETSLAEGARLAYQGTAPEGAAFLAPTILEVPEADAQSTAWREELFGPVLSVRRASGTDDALAQAGDSPFGLTAALFTRSIATALEQGGAAKEFFTHTTTVYLRG